MTLVIPNFIPIPRENYRLGPPLGSYWLERYNGSAQLHGGSGQGNIRGVEAVPLPVYGRRHSASLALPPPGTLFLRRSRDAES